jgi:hypothetical protein
MADTVRNRCFFVSLSPRIRGSRMSFRDCGTATCATGEICVVPCCGGPAIDGGCTPPPRYCANASQITCPRCDSTCRDRGCFGLLQNGLLSCQCAKRPSCRAFSGVLLDQPNHSSNACALVRGLDRTCNRRRRAPGVCRASLRAGSRRRLRAMLLRSRDLPVLLLRRRSWTGERRYWRFGRRRGGRLG